MANRPSAREWQERTIRNWPMTKLSDVSRPSRGGKSRESSYKCKIRTKHACSISIEHLLALWDSQNGCCALSNLSMTFKRNCLYAASLDRIDSSGGYTAGNVQLACKNANFLKNNLSNSEALSFIEAIRASSPYASPYALPS